MKIYYDLTKKERKAYLNEFKKTPIGKEMVFFKSYCLILASAVLLLGIYLGINDFEIADASCILVMIIMAITLIYEVYININFTAWLKNKYDIKRW